MPSAACFSLLASLPGRNKDGAVREGRDAFLAVDAGFLVIAVVTKVYQRKPQKPQA